MPLSDIVNVQITRETQTVSQAGFGTLMILGTFKNWNDLIRYYSNMQGVAEDFSPTDAVYQAAQSVFSQPITPTQLAIGRRQADSATVEVITAMTGKLYTTTINDTDYTITSTNSNLQSRVTMSADFVAGNVINVVLNTEVVGTITSVIDFDINFVSSNSIVATVNGVGLTPVVFNTNQATTIAALATQIETVPAVDTATVTDTRQITVTFVDPGANTVNSVITTGGASQPVATISQGGFVFDTDQLTTMTNIQTALEAQPNIESVDILPNGANPNRVLQINADPNFPGVINSFTVFLGMSQPTAAIVNTNQDVTFESVAALMVEQINATATDVTATDNFDGTFTIDAVTPGTPYTLSVSTNIVNATEGRLNVLDSSPSTLYQVTLNGVLIQYTSPVEVQSNEQIAAALTLLINAQTAITNVSATDNLDGTLELASETLGQTFVCQVTPFILSYDFGMIIQPLVATETVTDSLDAIVAVDDNWYALACTDRTSAIVQAIGAWVEARVKIFGTASGDPNIINESVGVDTTSIAAIFKNLGYVRSFVMYHQDSDSDYPECAWFGRCLPFQPGSETWAFKTLSGVAYSDLSTNQSNNARNKKANTYEYIGGVGITQNGTVAVGEYIDIVRGVDWLVSTIQTLVYGVLVNSPKVPYTDAGITTIEAQVLLALSQGISNNFITNDPEPVVTVPKAANVSSADKAARILRNVTFQATLAGAIQAVQIQGTVTV